MMSDTEIDALLDRSSLISEQLRQEAAAAGKAEGDAPGQGGDRKRKKRNKKERAAAAAPSVATLSSPLAEVASLVTNPPAFEALTAAKCSALGFDADAKPLSSFMLVCVCMRECTCGCVSEVHCRSTRGPYWYACVCERVHADV